MWKEILGYEGYYEVSSKGEVRSLDREVCVKVGDSIVIRKLKGKLMKLTEGVLQNGAPGYMVVNLRKEGVSNVVPVHVLVAKSFLNNPTNLPLVNHIDGDKHNNNISNLEWASYSENNSHALRTGLRSPKQCTINQYTISGVLLKTYSSVIDASQSVGISREAISHCINGRSKRAGGFVWKKIA